MVGPLLMAAVASSALFLGLSPVALVSLLLLSADACLTTS